MGAKRGTPAERFWRYVHPEPMSGCWLWVGSMGRYYGRLGVGKTNVLAHRLSYEMHKGPIPSGLQIDHLCRTMLCVNPDHLEAVTPEENKRRQGRTKMAALNAAKVDCKRGHPLSGDNLYINPGSGQRVCRKCRYMIVRRWKDARKAEIRQ